MKKRWNLVVALALFALGCTNVWAAQTTQPVKLEQLSATVRAVTGLVQVRASEDQPWQKATIGMVLPVGGECRTGPRSSITLTIPPDQVMTLDRLGTVKILEALRGEDKLKTDIGMKYGRVQYEVHAAGLQHESTIRSPSNALAIRGTRVIKTDDGIEFSVMMLEGFAMLEFASGESTPMGTGYTDTYDKSPLVVDDKSKSPADYNYTLSLSPYERSQSLSSGERSAVGAISYMATSGGSLQGGLNGYRGGSGGGLGGGTTPPPTDNTFALGNLSFNLSWTGDRSSGNSTPDIDLFVITPRGERLIPIDAPYISPDGAVVSKNHRGGSQTSLGVESVSFPTQHPTGQYSYGVHYNGTGDPATFKVLVYLDGKQINADFDDTVTELGRDVTLTLDVAAPQLQPAAASARAVPIPKLTAPKTSRTASQPHRNTMPATRVPPMRNTKR